MHQKSTKINMGRMSEIINKYSETPMSWCRREFGPGGTQQGKRWWYTSVLTGTPSIQTKRPYYEIVMYFRDPMDATLFALKFGADTNHN